MVSKILSATNIGFDGQIIEVECDTSRGLPGLQIVGLPNKAIDEAKERVRSAINNSHLDFPSKRVTINLAPANLPKDGAQFDLPIALAILNAAGLIQKSEVKDSLFAGELSLDGLVRPIRGVVGIAETAKKSGVKHLFIPEKNLKQALLIEGMEIIGVKSLADLYLHLKGERKIVNQPTKTTIKDTAKSDISIDDIHGQQAAKRALVIAAAGHHNILFTGPPGTGKTMLAKAAADLLPPISHKEQIEIAKIHSLVSETEKEFSFNRPFRSPHHTASHISLVGGGKNPKPGEISLAHLGVLFLDELPEYPRSSLEVLRQPLEDREIHISRADQKVKFPANFMMIATKNPCPCGFLGDNEKECRCSTTQILSYQKKLSGPLLDRIDLVVHVGKIPHEELLKKSSSNNADNIRRSIASARNVQRLRYKNGTTTNSSLSSKQIKDHIVLKEDVADILTKASRTLDLSTRAYFKVIRVAQTIADLDGSENIGINHMSEALQYRFSSNRL